MTYPARALAALTGASLGAVGPRLRIDGVIFHRDIWSAAYVAAGLALVVLAFIDRPVPVTVRAVIAAVATVAVVARSVALALAWAGGAAFNTAVLVGLIVWPLVAVYIVTLLAFWEHLRPLRGQIL